MGRKRTPAHHSIFCCSFSRSCVEMVDQQVLLLTESAVLDASVLSRVSQSLHIPLESFSVITASGEAALDSLPSRHFSRVLSLADSEGFHSSRGLQSLSGLVSPGGSLLLQELGGSQVGLKGCTSVRMFKARASAHLCIQESLCKALLLSGFVNARPAQALASHPTRCAVCACSQALQATCEPQAPEVMASGLRAQLVAGHIFPCRLKETSLHGKLEPRL